MRNITEFSKTTRLAFKLVLKAFMDIAIYIILVKSNYQELWFSLNFFKYGQIN